VKSSFDVAVVGSGFAGALLAIVCRRLGRSVVLLERGTHPRFAIGESSSPLANLLLEELCDRYSLDAVEPLCSWGSWQKRYPEIACGLKRGFTFYGHGPGKPFAADPERTDQLLVAASPRDDVADTHWYRADFDAFLVRQAVEEGVEYLDRARLDRALPSAGGGFELQGERVGRRLEIEARFVADASGPAGFLQRAFSLPASRFDDLPANEGLYTHFSDVARLEEIPIFRSLEEPPYPVDDAAVHHVFEGGWIWVLRFNNGLTSAGVSATPRLARELRLEEGEPAWRRLLARFPTIARQFEGSRAVRPFVYRPKLPYRAGAAAGDDWALLPSAAAFVDPLLSTGFPLTLLGVTRLARAIETSWGRDSLRANLSEYARRILFEADAAALLVSALFSSLGDFPLFAAFSKLYFAAASFSEAERRLSRNPPGRSFLCADHPTFGPAFRDSCRAALDRESRRDLLRRVDQAIEPLDVAGLGDASRRNWHPVLASDLVTGAVKLSAAPAEVEALLERTGFFAAAGTRDG
jgi:tetracycline 7-halogenase / FADH2 O2-dependent halogenase